MTKEFLNEVVKSLGGFVWLRNNLHNFYTPEFKEMLEAAMKDADKTYWQLVKIRDEMDKEKK